MEKILAGGKMEHSVKGTLKYAPQQSLRKRGEKHSTRIIGPKAENAEPIGVQKKIGQDPGGS